MNITTYKYTGEGDILMTSTLLGARVLSPGDTFQMPEPENFEGRPFEVVAEPTAPEPAAPAAETAPVLEESS